MILIKNLYFKYTREYYTLYDINLNIEANEKVALIGEDDIGKTTLQRILTKLERPESGEIYLKGIPLKKVNFSCDVSLAYIPYTPVFMESKTVYENLKYILKKQKVKSTEIESKINKTLINFNIEALKDVQVQDLSLFQKYLVSIARACLRKLEIVLIDGILERLEGEEREQIIEVIKNKFIKNNLTLVIATNDKEMASGICDKLVEIKSGSIVEDKT